MNHGDTNDTEIVSGDEGDPTPIEDISERDGDFGLQDAVEPVASEGDNSEELQTVEANTDWQPPIVDEAPILVETVSETVEPQNAKEHLTGWQRIRNLFGGAADSINRLNNLTQSIEDAPESAVNYVLRAEIYAELREYALAQADFQRAVELAEVQFELADWGLLDQTMRDRAIAGLEKVQRRMQ